MCVRQLCSVWRTGQGGRNMDVRRGKRWNGSIIYWLYSSSGTVLTCLLIYVTINGSPAPRVGSMAHHYNHKLTFHQWYVSSQRCYTLKFLQNIEPLAKKYKHLSACLTSRNCPQTMLLNYPTFVHPEEDRINIGQTQLCLGLRAPINCINV